jgi:hypothetical protein
LVKNGITGITSKRTFDPAQKIFFLMFKGGSVEIIRTNRKPTTPLTGDTEVIPNHHPS